MPHAALRKRRWMPTNPLAWVVFVTAATLCAPRGALANCYSFTNTSGHERYLNFSSNRPSAAPPAMVKLEQGETYPAAGQKFCVNNPDVRIEVYLGAGGSIVGWEDGQQFGAGAVEGFVMGDDSIATAGGDYKLD
jgi:hypothetical protein